MVQSPREELIIVACTRGHCFSGITGSWMLNLEKGHQHLAGALRTGNGRKLGPPHHLHYLLPPEEVPTPPALTENVKELERQQGIPETKLLHKN